MSGGAPGLGIASVTARARTPDGYLPIECYGVIGNLRTAALVGMDGAIDWCCFPELDSGSVFGALLDSRRGGSFAVRPAGASRSVQRYRDRSNVLETCFEVDGAAVTLIDFMPLGAAAPGTREGAPRPELHRVVRSVGGPVVVDVEWSPRLDYARSATRISRDERGSFFAESAGLRLTLAGIPIDGAGTEATVLETEDGPVLRVRLHLEPGGHVALVTRWGNEAARGGLRASLDALDATDRAWRSWCAAGEHARLGRALGGRWHERLLRTALALKLLTHPATGAIAAAVTTSLPEEIGGIRNWDYRFSWIRDAAFTSQALFAMGHRGEAVEFLEWMHGICAEKGDRPFGMQIMYGLRGETDLTERLLPHLAGYRGSRPVRVGNAAATQSQHDIYGELLGSAYELVRLGGSLDPHLMTFLSHVANRACEAWREPDYGIWEVRGGPRHFVYSKLMVWVALDRAIRMAERWGMPGDVELWRAHRRSVREAILREGWDERLGTFVQSFGSASLDAANLLIPIVEFLPFDDPRVQATVDRTLAQLTSGGMVYRYDASDGLPGGEGAFGLTTFWMVDALALSGRTDEAWEMFERMAGRANHLGLYSEEVDVATGAFLGNFPQAFSLVGFANSALYLTRAEGVELPEPAPVGTPEHREETGHPH